MDADLSFDPVVAKVSVRERGEAAPEGNYPNSKTLAEAERHEGCRLSLSYDPQEYGDGARLALHAYHIEPGYHCSIATTLDRQQLDQLRRFIDFILG